MQGQPSPLQPVPAGTPAPPPGTPLPVNGTSIPYAPSPIASPLAGNEPSIAAHAAALPALSQAIEHHESGGNPNAVSPVGARGPRQIMPATFRQWALPGENINNPADNRAVSDRMLAHYLQQYGGDAQRAAVAYFSGPGNVAPPGSPTPWISNKGDGNNTVAQYVAATAGRMGVAGTAPPVSSSAPASAPANFGQALSQGNIGGMLAALNAPGASGQSPLQTATSALGGSQQQQSSGGGGGGGGGSPAPPAAPPAPMAAPSPGLYHNTQVAQQAPALFAQATAPRAPLSWGRGVPGGGAGLQQEVPGTTLNSVGV